MNLHFNETSFNSQDPYQSEYTITLQFQLQRQKQKNKILQQRLKNKQIFIIEMKKMQSQIQLLSQKYREQLAEEREMRQYLEKGKLRQYAETIAQLQHKIKYLEGLESSKKMSNFDQKMYKQKNKSPVKIVPIYTQLKSKQMIKQRQKQQSAELQILKNFSNRFMQMFELYNGPKQSSLKRNLKNSWRWIKKVVRQWQQYQQKLAEITKYAQQCCESEQPCDPETILAISAINDEEQAEEDA